MECLRCGYCCINFDVMIVDDPNLGITKENTIYKPAGIKCKHLDGDKAGEYSCLVYNREWYNRTPCFDYGQVEGKITDECRIGRYTLDNNMVSCGRACIL